MSLFDQQLTAELVSIETAGLLRRVRRMGSPQGVRVIADGRLLRNFSSNDYLGLANHPQLIDAAVEATKRYGAGCGASRLICGSIEPHHALEEVLADFKGTQAALVFSTGFAAAQGAICALVGPGDVVILDKRVHACCVDAAVLSGATLRVFGHNNLEDLARKLQWADKRREVAPALSKHSVARRRPRILVVTESVFSMDGDLAPLREIVELKDRHGAWLLLDEAHATGLFGERGGGLAEAFGLSGRVEIQMGTLGKALGASGGYIAGSRVLIDVLINRARSFIFSTAPVPAAAAAGRAGVELAASGMGRELSARLWAVVDLLKNRLIQAGWPPGLVQSPILPVPVGDEAAAVCLADHLRDHGFLVPAIRYPTVSRGSARLRVTASAIHSAEDVADVAAVLGRWKANQIV
ncbi:MAG: 8-amino-7-oxononanoate synthase [Pedosphaera sp.]|nr:8-amino-7-oxononanoate synthase [Pedosphaera sp.]